MNEDTGMEAGYGRVLGLFSARTGLTFRIDQRPATLKAIRSVMESSGANSVDEYARLLKQDDRALDDLVVKLTVPETYFFREPAQFDFVRREILPEIRQRRGTDHVVRMWSAGCASGEEPYTLAIICKQDGLVARSHILATDISPAALAKARAASYSDWSLRGEGASTVREYLLPEGKRYQLDRQIRRQVQFEFLNLALDVYPSFVTGTVGLDLIFCRNVLIYLAPDTVKEVARRLYDSLAPGGWLITASGDPPIEAYADYETLMQPGGIFYRRPLVPAIATTPCPSPWTTATPAPVQLNSTAVTDPIRVADSTNDPSPTPVLSSPPSAETVAKSLSAARAALLRGDYAAAVESSERCLDDPSASALHIKAMANIDTARAVKASAKAAERHPLSPELHYLQAILLLEINRESEAIAAIRRVVFLDPTLAIAHFTLGSILRRRGTLSESRRCFRNARDLCEALPPDEVVPLTDGEKANQLAEAAEVQVASINAAIGD